MVWGCISASDDYELGSYSKEVRLFFFTSPKFTALFL